MEKAGCLIRVLLIGESGVGKNQLMTYFAGAKNSTMDYHIYFQMSSIIIDDIPVRVLLFHWNRLKQHLSNMQLQKWGKMLHGALVVYDVMNHSSLQKVHTSVNNSEVLTSLPLVIVGNKADLVQGGVDNIAILEGIQWSNKIGVPFHLTDAISGNNVEIAFINLIARCLHCVQNQSLPFLILSDTSNTYHDSDSINEACSSKDIATDTNVNRKQDGKLEDITNINSNLEKTEISDVRYGTIVCCTLI